MKRLIVFVVLLSLLAGNASVSYGEDNGKTAEASKKIAVYFKPDITVRLNGMRLLFRDSNEQAVYPIVYNGRTYLPLRAMSALMKEPVEWNASSKIIFLGMSPADRKKQSAKVNTAAVAVVSDSGITLLPKPELAEGYLKSDVSIMYNLQVQSFFDRDGNPLYPIIYNNSTYLPLRALSELLQYSIEWDQASKTVLLVHEDQEDLQEETVEEEPEPSLAAQKIKNLFELEEVLYYEATAKTVMLKQAASYEEKQTILTEISQCYLNAQKMTEDAKKLNLSGFTKREAGAYEKTVSFIESAEYYILLLENISYLAAQNEDYSMLAEIFQYYAFDSQVKMEEARERIQALH